MQRIANMLPQLAAKIFDAVIVILLLSAPFQFYELHKSLFPDCEVNVIQILTSPDGVWDATMTERACPRAFSYDIFDIIKVTMKKEPRKDIDLLMVDVVDHPHQHPQMRWSESDVLRTTFPYPEAIQVINKNFGTGRLDVRDGNDEPIREIPSKSNEKIGPNAHQ